MAIKIGNQYVSEAAYAHAQKSAAQAQQCRDMQTYLMNTFPSMSFSTNTQPFSATGTNNMAISPNILTQMANDPHKRMEYEALIYDCNAIQKSFGNTLPTGSKIESQGFIIDAQGNLTGWCVTKPSGGDSKKSLVLLPKEDKKSWLEKIAEEVKQAAYQPWDARA